MQLSKYALAALLAVLSVSDVFAMAPPAATAPARIQALPVARQAPAVNSVALFGRRSYRRWSYTPGTTSGTYYPSPRSYSSPSRGYYSPSHGIHSAGHKISGH